MCILGDILKRRHTMSIPNVFPASFTNPLEKAYQVTEEYVQKAQTLYKQAEDRAVTILKEVLPNEMHTVAEKVARSVPETLFSASMITGTMKVAASIFGIVRLAWAATPIIQTALKGDFDGEPMNVAARQAFERLKQINDSFRPAIFLACGVGAVASTVLGALSFSPTLVMTGAFLGMISYLALESMTEVKAEAAAQVPVPVNDSPPQAPQQDYNHHTGASDID